MLHHQGQSKTLRYKLICLFKGYFTDHLGNSLILTGKVRLSKCLSEKTYHAMHAHNLRKKQSWLMKGLGFDMGASSLIPSVLVNCILSSLAKSPNQCCKLSLKIPEGSG